MKILVVGNSHSAAICSAIEQFKHDGGPSFDHFAMPGRNAPQLYKDGDSYSAVRKDLEGVEGSTPKGLRSSVGHRFNSADYDVVVVSSLVFSAPSNEILTSRDHALADAKLFNWKSSADWHLPSLSMKAFSEYLLIKHSHSGIAHLVKDFSPAPGQKCFLLVAPPPNIAVLESQDWLLTEAYGSGVEQVIRDYGSLCLDAARLLSTNFTIVPPPESTVERGFLRSEFMSGNDLWHANREYGVAVLSSLMTALQN